VAGLARKMVVLVAVFGCGCVDADGEKIGHFTAPKQGVAGGTSILRAIFFSPLGGFSAPGGD
jgi:hypothetical protein